MFLNANKHFQFLVVFSALFISILLHAKVETTDAVIGKISVVNGKVSIKSVTGFSRPAKPGDQLMNNDTVNTDASSTAKLLFTDQSIIDLGPSSSFKISDYALKNTDNRTGTFSLMFGKMRSLVTKKVGEKGKVQFKAGNSVMGVRGTEFVVDAPKGANGVAVPKVVVVSGIVAVGNLTGGAPVLVKQGEAVNANFGMNAAGANSGATSGSGDSSPQVQKVSSSEMQSVVSSSKSVDNTFDSAVSIKPTSSEGSGSGGSKSGGEGGGSLALNTVQGIVGNSVAAQTDKSAKSEMRQMSPEFLNQNGNFLPPVNLVPGGLIHLSVGVQK